MYIFASLKAWREYSSQILIALISWGGTNTGIAFPPHLFYSFLKFWDDYELYLAGFFFFFGGEFSRGQFVNTHPKDLLNDHSLIQCTKEQRGPGAESQSDTLWVLFCSAKPWTPFSSEILRNQRTQEDQIIGRRGQP